MPICEIRISNYTDNTSEMRCLNRFASQAVRGLGPRGRAGASALLPLPIVAIFLCRAYPIFTRTPLSRVASATKGFDEPAEWFLRSDAENFQNIGALLMTSGVTCAG